MTPSEKFAQEQTNYWINQHFASNDSMRNAKSINREINTDSSLKNDYRGRVLLELLQNADDAATKHKTSPVPTVKFILTNTSLQTLNHGITFNEDSLINLSMGGTSGKEDDEEATGAKGVGFRGTLNWSNDIKIYSGEFAISFSESHCKKELAQLQKQYPQTYARLNKTKLFDKLPILSFPQAASSFPSQWQNNKYIDNGTNYDTCVELMLTPDKTRIVQNDLSKFITHDLESILFMRTLKKIEIQDKISNTYHCLEINATEIKTNLSEKNITVHEKRIIINGNATQTFTVFTRGKEAIAVPNMFTSEKSYPLFCVFPIHKDECPFPVIMNSGKFELQRNREALIANSEQNAKIIERLMQLFTDIIPYFATHAHQDCLAIKLLHHKKADLINKFHIDADELYSKISSMPIIPTTDGTFKSLDDELNHLHDNAPEYIATNAMGKYAQRTAYDALNFIPELQRKIHLPTSEKLFELINKNSCNWSPEQHIDVFYFWADTIMDKYTKHLLPKLLKTDTNEFFSFSTNEHDTLMLDTDQGIDISDINWLNLNKIHPDYKKILHEQFIQRGKKSSDKKTINRELYEQYQGIFIDGDKSQILTKINANLDGQYNRAITLIKYIYKNYSADSIDSNATLFRDTNWQFPTQNGTIKKSKDIYFGGDEYGETTDTKICALAGMHKFIAPQTIISADDSIEDFRNLIKKFGVSEKISFETTKIDPNDCVYSAYKKHAESLLKPRLSQNNINLKEIKSIETKHIPRLDMILKRSGQNPSSIETILKWIKSIMPLHSDEAAKIDYIHSTWASGTQRDFDLPNYVLYQLRTTPWLTDKNNTPISPEHCRINTTCNECPRELLNFTPESTRSYNDIWKLIGAKENMAMLPASDFYRILKTMSENDQNKKYCETLYSYIARNSVPHLLDSTPENTAAKQDFITNGRLLAQKATDTTPQFYPVSKVFVAPGAANNANLSDTALIVKPQRNGAAEDFAKIFGIKIFSEKIELNPSMCQDHPDNPDFQSDFKEFRPYLIAFKATENLSRVAANIKFILKQSIFDVHGNNIGENLKDYFCIREKEGTHTYYIKLSENKTFNAIELGEAIAKECNAISNSEDIINDIFILYTNDNSYRKKYLSDKGYSLDSSDQIRKSFTDLVNHFAHEKNTIINIPSELDFDNLDAIENAKHFIQILSDLGVTVQDFEQHGFNINLVPYNANLLKDYIETNKNIFQASLYQRLNATQDIEKQKNFEQTIRKFDTLPRSEKIPNTHDFCVKTFINTEYPDLSFDDTVDASIYSDAPYNANLAAVLSALSEISEDDLSADDKSLLHFGHSNIVISKHTNNQAKKPTAAPTLNTNPDITKIQIQLATTDDIPDTADKSRSKKRPSGKLGTNAEKSAKKSERTKQINGKNAEYLVYKKMCEDYGKSNVRWISSNAPNDITKKSDIDDGAGYDIEVKFPDNTYHRIEVKSATKIESNMYQFEITKNEIETSQDKKFKYHVYGVTDNNTIKDITDKALSNAITNGTVVSKICTFKLN